MDVLSRTVHILSNGTVSTKRFSTKERCTFRLTSQGDLICRRQKGVRTRMSLAHRTRRARQYENHRALCIAMRRGRAVDAEHAHPTPWAVFPGGWGLGGMHICEYSYIMHTPKYHGNGERRRETCASLLVAILQRAMYPTFN